MNLDNNAYKNSLIGIEKDYLGHFQFLFSDMSF